MINEFIILPLAGAMVDHGESRQQAAPQTPARNKVSFRNIKNNFPI